MTDILIRGLDPATVSALKASAAANKRSLQQELRGIVEEAAALAQKREGRQRFIEATDRLRAEIAARPNRPRFDSTEFIRRDRDSGYGRLYWPYDDLV